MSYLVIYACIRYETQLKYEYVCTNQNYVAIHLFLTNYRHLLIFGPTRLSTYIAYIHFMVIQAKNLKQRKMFNKPNSYIRITYKTNINYTSKTCYKSLNPKWYFKTGNDFSWSTILTHLVPQVNLVDKDYILFPYL